MRFAIAVDRVGNGAKCLVDLFQEEGGRFTVQTRESRWRRIEKPLQLLEVLLQGCDPALDDLGAGKSVAVLQFVQESNQERGRRPVLGPRHQDSYILHLREKPGRIRFLRQMGP